jgi:hypothetical protein
VLSSSNKVGLRSKKVKKGKHNIEKANKNIQKTTYGYYFYPKNKLCKHFKGSYAGLDGGK